MNIFSWIFLGLFLIDTILHLVFWFKKFQIAAELSGAFLVTAGCFFIICLLINYLPDSWHIITFASIGAFLYGAGYIFNTFSKKVTFLSTVSKACVLSSCYVWTALFHSIFYLTKVSTSVHIAGIVIFLAIFALLSIYTGKKTVTKLFKLLLRLSGPAFLFYCSLICISADFDFYSTVLTTGSLLMLVNFCLVVLNDKRNFIKNQNLIILFKTILPAAAELLITAGSLLMIH